MKRWPLIVAIAGIGTLIAQQEIREPNNFQPSSQIGSYESKDTPKIKKDLSKYIEREATVIGNPDRPTLYVVHVAHALTQKHGLSPQEVAGANMTVALSQACTYRIVEDLYKNHGVKHVSHEGISYNDLSDVLHPDTMRAKAKERGNYSQVANIVAAITAGNDDLLLNQCAHGNHGAMLLTGWQADLYVTGFERKDVKKEAHKALRDAKLANPNLSEDDVDKILLPYEEKRADFAIESSIHNARQLQAQGKITDPSTILVVGYKWADNIAARVNQIDQQGFNLEVIATQGLPKGGADWVIDQYTLQNQ